MTRGAARSMTTFSLRTDWVDVHDVPVRMGALRVWSTCKLRRLLRGGLVGISVKGPRWVGD